MITINGSTAVTMQSLNLAFTGLDLANMNVDVASLKWTRRRASVACPLAHNDTVEIFRAGTRLFRGRARLGTMTHEGAPIRILGPWSHLDEQLFQLSLGSGNLGMPDGLVLGDTYVVAYPPYTLNVAQSSTHNVTFTVTTRSRYTGWPATTGESDVNMGWASRAWLFRPQGSFGWIYTTIADEWERLMTLISTINDTPLFTEGTVELGGDISPRVRTVSDITLSEAMRQILAMKPDAAVWWEYSGSGVPVLRARVASLETSTELTIGTRTGQALAGYQLKAADDLVPTGVVVAWERDASTSTGLGTPYLADFFPGSEVITNADVSNGSTQVDCDSTANLVAGMAVSGTYVPTFATISSITNSTRFVLSNAATGTLSGQRMIARAADGVARHQPGILLHTVTDEMTFVPGIAKEIYTSLATRRAQGSLTVVDRDFTQGLRPGAVFTLAGDPAFEGVQLWVQSVSWSPDTGLAQLTVGYPAHLQLRDRIDLRGWLRASFTGALGEVSSWIIPPP